MAEQTTFIKIDRNLRNWRWFKNPKTLTVWMWLLLSANIEAHDFERDTIQRGEVATSRKSISADTGLSEREVRTALNHLKETGEVTVRLRPKYQVISIVEYDKYQAVRSGNESGKSPAKVRQKSGKRPQSKNIRMEEGKEEKNVCVTQTPALAEVEEFFREKGRSAEDAGKFYAYNNARGWKMGRTKIEDWHSAVDIWMSLGEDRGATDDGTERDSFGKPMEEFK